MAEMPIEEITPEQFSAEWGDKGIVLDAVGRWHTYLLRWNLKTGELLRYVYPFELDESHRVRTFTEFVPAPLTFAPFPPLGVTRGRA